MRLTAKQGYALLDKHGSYITEVCDRCDRGIGAVRFTRRGDAGVWCSRECRGECDQRQTLKPGRPRKYKNGEERRAAKTQQQRNYRSGRGVEKIVCTLAETKDLQTQKLPLSTTPLTPAILHR
jgi:hypothetical protein